MMHFTGTVIELEDNFCVLNYKDIDNHNSYGYLHWSEIDDLYMAVEDKVNVGDQLEFIEWYRNHGDMYLSCKRVFGRTFKERCGDLNTWDTVTMEVKKITSKGSAGLLPGGIVGIVKGNYEVGDHVLCSVKKIDEEQEVVYLIVESVVN